MDDLYIELRTLHRGSISRDIAEHLFTRQFLGTAIVISDKPAALASSLGKQWWQLGLNVRRARSSTLQRERIREIDREIAHMEQIRIVAWPPTRTYENAEVLVVEPSNIHIPPDCQTLYIACKISDETLQTVLQAMPPHAVVVRY